MDPELIRKMLFESGAYTKMFDLVRVVDPEETEVMEKTADGFKSTGSRCSALWGRNERCKNCISLRAFYSGEQMVKLEYTGDSVFLIISAPFVYEGRPYVAELGKNVTKSMTVANLDNSESGKVVSMIDQLNKIAVTDALTGVFNRRYIDDVLPASLQNCEMMGIPLSVALVDADLFKNVNDTYGHQAGDSVICALAGVLQGHMRRNSDFVARYGGEEFLMCYPGMPLDACRGLLESVRIAVERIAINHGGGEIKITISAGLADNRETNDAAALIALADERLYEAKRTGRNRVVGGWG